MRELRGGGSAGAVPGGGVWPAPHISADQAAALAQAGIGLVARPFLARLGDGGAQAVEAALDPALELSRGFVEGVTEDPGALDQYRERLHDALESFMSDPLATPLNRAMEREELRSAALEPVGELLHLARDRTVESVDASLRRAVQSPLVRPVIMLAGETDEEVEAWISRVDGALAEALEANPLSESELDALQKLTDILWEPSGDERLVRLLPPAVRERLAAMRRRVGERRAAFREGVRNLEHAVEDGSVGRLVQDELRVASERARAFREQLRDRLAEAFATRGGSRQETGGRLQEPPAESRTETRDATKPDKPRRPSRPTLKAMNAGVRADRERRILGRLTKLAKKLLKGEPSAPLRKSLGKVAAAASERPAKAKKLKNRLRKELKGLKERLRGGETYTEKDLVSFLPEVMASLEEGGGRRKALQLQQFESHPFFAQFVTQMADRMQPILKQAHEAASDALSEFQAQADARWSEEQAAMQEFRDSHPAPEGGTIDGSDAPPGTRMFRSAFRAAEALLGRISQGIDDQIAQSTAYGGQLWGGAPAVKAFRERIGAVFRSMFARADPQTATYAMHQMLDPGLKLDYDLATLVDGEAVGEFERYRGRVDEEIQAFLQAPPDGSVCAEECRIKRAQKIWEAVLAPAEAAFRSVMGRAKEDVTRAVDDELRAVTAPLRPFLRRVGQEDELDAYIASVDEAVHDAAFNFNHTGHEDVDAWAEVAERIAAPQIRMQEAAAEFTGLEPVVDIRAGIQTAREHIHERLSYLEARVEAATSPEALLELSDTVGEQVQTRIAAIQERIRSRMAEVQQWRSGQAGQPPQTEAKAAPGGAARPLDPVAPGSALFYRPGMPQDEFEVWLASRVQSRLGLAWPLPAELTRTIHQAASVLSDRPRWLFQQIAVLEGEGQSGSALVGALVSRVRQRAMKSQVRGWEGRGCDMEQIQELLHQFWMDGEEWVVEDPGC